PVAIPLIVVGLDELTPKVALAADTVVAVPLEVGSLPSVVYWMLLTSDPPSVALSAICTGVLVYQPEPQLAALHWIDVLGAVVSACAVNARPELVSPALFVAVIEPACVVDDASNV